MLRTYLASILFFLCCSTSLAAPKKQSLEELEYRIFPRRTAEEAAVLEWGHSAIISALDASVAMFGPQTVDAALLEVECRPVLASPLNGVDKNTKLPVTQLENKDETHGNMVVMTNTGKLTGMQMTKIAIESGAAALLVVNMDEDYPDDIYRLELQENEESLEVDIPVVMISLNSANVLTSATVTPDMQQEDIVNSGMPDRVRLYAGGDRPFFEDVEPVDPTLYLIHNIMTQDECDSLVQQATFHGMDDSSTLLLSHDSTKQQGMDKIVLWKGALQSYAGKQVEERMEQVTGFPVTHYSDFVIYSLQKNSLWQPHYDVLVNGQVPMATITVFLTDSSSPTIVYPSIDNEDDDNKDPQAVKILAQKGMAIVHHNLENQRHSLDRRTLHAWMPSTSEETVYVARKYIFATPPSTARRMVLPIMAAPFGGKLPRAIYQFHAFMVNKFGYERGDAYFDKTCVFVPLLLVLCLAQAIANYVQSSMTKKSKTTKKD